MEGTAAPVLTPGRDMSEKGAVLRGIVIGVLCVLGAQLLGLACFLVLSRTWGGIEGIHSPSKATGVAPSTSPAMPGPVAPSQPQAATPDPSLAISVTVTSKTYVKAPDGTYDMHITMVVSNTSPHDVRVFKGRIVFADLLGDNLREGLIIDDRGVKAGTQETFRTIEKAFVTDADLRLRKLPLSNLNIRWEPEAILFGDGTNWHK